MIFKIIRKCEVEFILCLCTVVKLWKNGIKKGHNQKLLFCHSFCFPSCCFSVARTKRSFFWSVGALANQTATGEVLTQDFNEKKSMQNPEFQCILETSHSHVLWRAAIPSFNRSTGQRLNLQSSASNWVTDEFCGVSSTIYELRKKYCW